MTTELEEKGPPLWFRLTVGRRPIWTIVRLILWVVLAVVVFKLLLIPIRVTGRSMLPTYPDGSIHFLYRFAYRHKPPALGDVVGIYDPGIGRGAVVLKRILAGPRQSVRMRRGILYVDGQRVQDSFSQQFDPTQNLQLNLGEDEYFAMGDNRAISAAYAVSVRPTERSSEKGLSIGRIVGKLLY
jgi:signal peptidase I